MPDISCLFFYFFFYSKREKIKGECNGGKLHLLKAPYFKIYTRYGHEILNTYLLLHLLSDATSLIPKYIYFFKCDNVLKCKHTQN